MSNVFHVSQCYNLQAGGARWISACVQIVLKHDTHIVMNVTDGCLSLPSTSMQPDNDHPSPSYLPHSFCLVQPRNCLANLRQCPESKVVLSRLRIAQYS